MQQLQIFYDKGASNLNSPWTFIIYNKLNIVWQSQS